MTEPGNKKITYKDAGVNYETMDPTKIKAQLRASSTEENLRRFGMREVEASRGESAYVWEDGSVYRAFVIEGLGTKNLVADEVRRFTGRTHYDDIAQDTVAMITNDLIAVGADPQVVTAYWAVGNSDWFLDEQRSEDLVDGWARASSMAGAVWGGGETPSLGGVVVADTIDLSGSAIGVIDPKSRLTLGDKLTPGDEIVMIDSSGIHANGLSIARRIASELPEGYATRLSDGTTYGETLLTPTHIYATLIRELFNSGVDIHYMSNITGHGWRKIMRADKDLTYVITRIPDTRPIFEFLQHHSRNDDSEMWGNFNMGGGFAVFLPKEFVPLVRLIAVHQGFNAFRAGFVDEGPKQVLIQPKGLIYKGESLGVR